MEGVSLIDVSSEDDLLIAASTDGSPNPPTSGNSVKYEHNWVVSEAVNVCEEVPMKMSKKMEQVPGLSESPEHKKQAKHGNHIMRKSLAWDKAFFTSEGVLNTEELGIVNSTFRKAQQSQTLPGIQEDVRRSSDSTSTLEGGDGWGLETLEVDLFENLRASIQKSIDKAPTSEIDPPRFRSLKAGLSQNKLKPPTVIRRHDMKQQRDDGASKDPLVRVKVAGSGNRDSKGSLKPPKIIASGVPSKKSSGSCNVQIRSSQAPGNGVEERQSVKKNLTPRSVPSNQGNVDNSRKRSGRCIDHPSSGSAPKTPVRASKATIASRNTRDHHHPPSRLNPGSKFSSSLSPSSSIESFVSESSSSSNSIALHSTESNDADSPALGNRIPRQSESRKLSMDRSKPSGLRMPTPKIGYFDAEKSLVRSSKTAGVSKSQLGKLQPSRDSPFARSGVPRAAKNPESGRVKVFEKGSGAADVAEEKSSDPSRGKGESESEPHVLWLSYIKEGFTQKENSFPGDENVAKMEVLERGVSSLSLTETKDLDAGRGLEESKQQRPRVLSSPKEGYMQCKENENSFPGDKMELLERRVSSLSLSETKDLSVGRELESGNLIVMLNTVDPGPNARVPLVDKFLQ